MSNKVIQSYTVQSLSCVWLFATPWFAWFPCPFPRICLNLCPLSQWCHPAILSSVIPFPSYLQSFPASGSFPMSWLFASGGQSTGVSASASVLPINIQDCFLLGLIGLISLQSKEPSRIFSSTTIWKHQSFLGAQYFLTVQSSHPWLHGLCQQSDASAF